MTINLNIYINQTHTETHRETATTMPGVLVTLGLELYTQLYHSPANLLSKYETSKQLPPAWSNT